jgi:hypothetical protein
MISPQENEQPTSTKLPTENTDEQKSVEKKVHI